MFIEKLNNEFALRRAKNSAYSLRAFARHLVLSPAALGEILRRKRSLSEKMRVRISKRLNWDVAEFAKSNFYVPAKIDLDQFSLISGWHHFAILSLAETKGYIPSPKWIAERLPISTAEARSALSTLQKVGLLDVEHQIPEVVQYHTPSDVPHLAIQMNHIMGCKLAMDAITQQDVEGREFNGSTIAMSKDKIPEVKKILRETVAKLERLSSSGKPEEVFRINTHFFQLSINEKAEVS